MSSSNQRSYIDDRSRFTVYGWIRKVKKLYNWANFPLSELASIIVQYFASVEMFKTIAKCVELSEDKLSVTKKKGESDWRNACYGSVTIPSKSNIICEWELKISNPPGETAGIVLGIARKEDITQYLWDTLKDKDQYVYAYGNWSAKTNARDIDNVDYGDGEYHDNCKVKIHLNMKLGQISFSIEDLNHGIAFDNIKKGDDIEYRLMVSLFFVGGKVEILDFHSK